MAHIESISIDLMVGWIEDQPVIRPVKDHFVNTGIVSGLVGCLKEYGSEAVGTAVQLNGRFDGVDVNGRYVCEVTRPPANFRGEGVPAFFVYIRKAGKGQLWDAVGEIYVAPFPDWITAAYKQLHSTSQAGK